MCLSNPRKSFVLAILCLLALQGCGSPAGNENKPLTLAAEPRNDFPLAAQEPEIYQADVVIASNYNDRTFIARNGEKSRYDRFRGGELEYTELTTDRAYTIDHRRKMYSESPVEAGDRASLSTPGFDFFKGKEHLAFDEVSREGGVIRYRVRPTDLMKDEITIDVDAGTGMVLRQEFKSSPGGNASPSAGFVYELRNFRQDVDESVFALPAGFRKVSREEIEKHGGERKITK